MTPDLPLWSCSPDLERDKQRLTELCGELALRAGKHGVTSSDVRINAVNRGILTGEESESLMNKLSIGRRMIEAGLVATELVRKSDVPKAKGSKNVVYVLPEFAEVVA